MGPRYTGKKRQTDEDEQVHEEEPAEGEPPQFSSVSKRVYTTGKKARIRRKWTETADIVFSHEWALEIELSRNLNKKPTLSEMKQKLALMVELQDKYKDLSAENIKDKIWNLAKRSIGDKK